MKVWELIAELSKYKAGDEVKVSLANTLSTSIVDVELLDEGEVSIAGGDTNIVDSNGDIGEWLSNLASTDESDDE